jgi:hypothetical protein
MDSRVFYLVCTSCDARAYTMDLAYAHEEERCVVKTTRTTAVGTFTSKELTTDALDRLAKRHGPPDPLPRNLL